MPTSNSKPAQIADQAVGPVQRGALQTGNPSVGKHPRPLLAIPRQPCRYSVSEQVILYRKPRNQLVKVRLIFVRKLDRVQIWLGCLPRLRPRFDAAGSEDDLFDDGAADPSIQLF